MPSQEEIDQQQELLAIYRGNVAHYLRQEARLGDAYVPPGVANGLREARLDIQRIKQILSGWDVSVEDHLEDEESADESVNTQAPHKQQTFTPLVPNFISLIFSIIITVLALVILIINPYVIPKEGKVQPNNITPNRKNSTDSGGESLQLGYTRPSGENTALLLAHTQPNNIYHTPLKEEPWIEPEFRIRLQKIREPSILELVWDVHNYTNRPIAISSDFINKIDILDENGNTYLSGFSSCVAISICATSGFKLQPNSSTQITNTININPNEMTCQKLFVIKPSLDLKLTRVWLVYIKCQ